MIIQLKNPAKAANIFSGWDETMLWSCLQGLMGEIWADDAENPTAARAELGDFAFLAGTPNAELIQLDTAKPYLIMTPQNEAWARLIEQCLGEKAKPALRYAILKEENVFDREKLMTYARTLPEGYILRPIDADLYHRCLQEGWSVDLVKNFATWEQFERYGLGVVAVKDNEIVAGASSYSAYDRGIEVEVDTQTAHRRKGLATACSAQLILLCLDRGLYPSWDAANLWSVALAEKLGYHRGETYGIYYWERED